MDQFKIKENIEIPYYDEVGHSFLANIKFVANNRNMNVISYLLYKAKNTVCLFLANSCPLNNLRVLLHRWRGVNIGKGVYIGKNVFIDNLYPEYVYIEDNAAINAESMLIAHFNPSIRFKRVLQANVLPILIKKGALVTVRCIILPGVVIGEDAIVSAGSVVNEDVESRTLVRGNPAKKVGRIKL